MRRGIRDALVVAAVVLVGAVVTFMLTNKKCVQLDIRNGFQVPLHEIAVRTRNANLLDLERLAPGERWGETVCVSRSARWTIQYRVDGSGPVLHERLDDVYIDIPRPVHVNLLVSPEGTTILIERDE